MNALESLALTILVLGVACTEDTTGGAGGGQGGMMQTGGGGGQGGQGGAPDTGACGGPGEACENSCTGMGVDGDCQGCAMTSCSAEVDACTTDPGDGTGCLGCADLLLGGGAPPQACGFNGDGCDPGTSCSRFQDLGTCMCGE